MNFYDPVTADTALEWYNELPAHLKKTIDESKSKYKNGRECTSKEHPDIFERVRSELGTRPKMPPSPAHILDGYSREETIQIELLNKWASKYDELLLIKLITQNAPNIQRDRRLLNKAMGVGLDTDGLPNQAEGLDPVQAATIAWVQNSGETPLELLTKVYRDDEARMSDRISAAKTLMDYVHRRVPVKQEVETKDLSVPKLNPNEFKGLSVKEIEVLEKLLQKINGL